LVDGAVAAHHRGEILAFRHEVFDHLSSELALSPEIRYASRTKILTDYYAKLYEKDVLLKRILDKVPSAKLTREDRELKQRLSDLPEVTILNLIYQKAKYEGMANDAEFSSLSMRDHWQAGYRDTVLTIKHKDWLTMSGQDVGVVMHDIHRPDGTPPTTPPVRLPQESIANALP
jgi:NTE family protein